MSACVENLTRGVKTVAVVCNQWGDTGKGKIVDFLSEWADIIARGTGGANAGHTIVRDGRECAFHLIPSGIMHDKAGKTNIIGSGVAFDPAVFCEELEFLKSLGLSWNHLKIALNAKLVLPQHIFLDRFLETVSTGKIGTTGRGIGPVYADHVARHGLVVNDLLNPDIFKKKLERNLREKEIIFRNADPVTAERIMKHRQLQEGRFTHPEKIFDIDAIIAFYLGLAEKFSHLVCNTDELVRSSHGKKNILLEGAQGLLLSVDYGSYPYVTSSDCSVQGLAKGVGLETCRIDRVLGIAKAFYMTRVGEGPFPTELGGKESAEWCNTPGVTEREEREKYSCAGVNDSDKFTQGVGIRFAGSEYGATTRRPRRVGWFDIPLLRYAVKVNGTDVVLTKLDVLNVCQSIKICFGYIYTGSDVFWGKRLIKKGDILYIAIPCAEILEHCEPMYMEFPGWQTSLAGIRQSSALPEELQSIIRYVQKEAGVKIRLVSLGREREKTIFCDL